jgi:hypothetical protein
MKLALSLMIAAAVHTLTPPEQRELEPAVTPYSYGSDDTDDASLCGITLHLLNVDPPQVVDATAFAGYGREDGTSAVGLVVAGTMSTPSQPNQGRPVTIEELALHSGTFDLGAEFEYQLFSREAALAATSNVSVAEQFLEVFVAGDYTLTLNISDPIRSTRSYRITAPVPSEVEDRFTSCLDKLTNPAFAGRSGAGLPHF